MVEPTAYIITIEDAGGSRMSTEVSIEEMALSHDARDRLIDAADVLVSVFLHQTGVPYALRPGEIVRRRAADDQEPFL